MEPGKKRGVRCPRVEGRPGPAQEVYSEESYGNFTSSVVRREVICSRGTSVTSTIWSQTPQGKVGQNRNLSFSPVPAQHVEFFSDNVKKETA